MPADGTNPPPSGGVPPPRNPSSTPHGPPPQGPKVAGPPVGPGARLSTWWKSFSGQQGKNFSSATAAVKSRLQKAKFAMPVDVKVDFLRPTVEAVRETSYTVWNGLPPPVQQAAPFVGAAMGGGAVVFLMQQRRIRRLKEERDEFQERVALLQREKEELIKKINALEIKSGTSRVEVESRMAVAVAEATNAAAAAADAAARAATACIFERPPSRLPSNAKTMKRGASAAS